MRSTRPSPAGLPSIEVSPDTELATLRPFIAAGSIEDLPGWVERALDGSSAPGGEELVLRSLRVPDAAVLHGGAFIDAVRDAYGLLLGAEPDAQLVRAWNFVPDIRRVFDVAEIEPLGRRADQEASSPSASMDRYMLFNAGRAAGFQDHRQRDRSPDMSPGASHRSATFPAATGVGHAGRDFVVHGLFARRRASASSAASATDRDVWRMEPVENPRQVPAWRYSSRWGPTPPSFARATRVRRGERVLLLVSGTASVRGEASQHEADVVAQLAESLENLRSVVRIGVPSDGPDDPLRRVTSIRIYLPRPDDALTVDAAIEGSALAGVERELVVAPLCREELLVEIEGVAACADGMELLCREAVRSDTDAGGQP